MDTLSRLLSLHPIQAALDKRYRMTGNWKIEHAEQPHGIVPYHLILEGDAWLDVEGHEPLLLSAGDMLVLARGHRHCLHLGDPAEACVVPPLTLASDDPSRIVKSGDGPLTDILCGQLLFGTAAQGTLISALPDIVLVKAAGRADLDNLQTLVRLLRDEASGSRPGASAVVSHLASALFSLLMRAWLEQTDVVPGLFALLAENRLAPALQSMLVAPENAWTMDQLAQQCNMSRSTFMRLFRKVSAITPGDLLIRIRMAQASIWLKQVNLGIGEISEAVGYHSEAAFNRAFKRWMGIGPGQYRRSALKHAHHADLYWTLQPQ